ncbi:unnamed protein product [Bursaphelenchus xylophilus]|uniref:(pine wood nematode) hypothetical protein n=1 Tax=Bursaphelenchus xylophilus TaxID=6326 RepID=A0A1I7S4T3_BURXY|nr:unnamed protein product [Bursaphelenchus xylophilus]CAG9117360.1 unnamed protein product [Bursaphelenchus xylophilus]
MAVIEEVNEAGTSETTLESLGNEPHGPVNTDEVPYPLDIIVKNIEKVVANREDDSSDDEGPAREVNYALQMQGFNVVEKENGADCVFLTCDAENRTGNGDPQPAETKGGKAKFKKGHRRAFSMPNAHHRDKALLVVAENDFRQEGTHRRHLVRYRLHPYHQQNEAAINRFIETTNLNLNVEDDIEVEYDEEEINVTDEDPGRTRFRIARRIWEARWKVQDFHLLPEWLQDNEFLHSGHRPPLPSFTSCFKSIFQLHTETGNIWTHLYGCVAFIGVAAYFLTRPNDMINWRDKLVFSNFFAGAIFCLGLSFSFHTVQCHSQGVGKLFSKLDYSGITMLIVGSFVPWIYYSFYCRTIPKVIYIGMIVILGTAALVVSLWDKFSEPKFRALRAIVFVLMGLSSFAPVTHLFITDGFDYLVQNASLQWIVLMGVFYLVGAAIYAFRFPERFCPGRCDLFCHSHQLFHIFVIIAAFVHFHGISELAMKQLGLGSCREQLISRFGKEQPSSFLDEWFMPS